MWLALSGLITGAVVGLSPTLSINIQVFIFSACAIVAVTAWRLYGKKYPAETDQPLLNKRGAQYIGRIFPLYAAIENGEGKIKVDDTIWKVQGEDCDISTKVKVTGMRGMVLYVEKVG